MEANKGRIYTREDIVNILNADIRSCIDRFGTYSYWTKRATEYKESALATYDAGGVIFVEREEYHEDGMDFSISYYSNGTVSHECYGYID